MVNNIVKSKQTDGVRLRYSGEMVGHLLTEIVAVPTDFIGRERGKVTRRLSESGARWAGQQVNNTQIGLQTKWPCYRQQPDARIASTVNTLCFNFQQLLVEMFHS